MSLYRKKSFWLPGLLFAGVFVTLFTIRIDLWSLINSAPRSLKLDAAVRLSDTENWMSIYQEDQKIGYAHRHLVRLETGYRVKETVLMRINTMGLVQEVRLHTTGELNPDFTVSDFHFQMSSGRFDYMVEATVKGRKMSLTTRGAGSSRTFELELQRQPYLVNGILDVIRTRELKPGRHWTFTIFDPGTLGQADVSMEIIGPERITWNEASIEATKVLLTFKGTTQLAWLDENGDVVQEEGLLGIRMIKSDRATALAGITDRPGRDLTRMASVGINGGIAEPEALEQLKLTINGVSLDNANLHGGRQHLEGRTLTITKESLQGLPEKLEPEDLGVLEKIFLDPSPFIQADHPAIVSQVRSIVEMHRDSPLVKARKLIGWMQRNISRRPVLSVPDALTTFKNRIGDCNEHAVLMAALARAAGVPARVEAGLVYLDGRFYYHAWNQLFVGRWVTADALYGQLPADVTHIRFAAGTRDQLDLMGLIGKVELEIVEKKF